MGAAVLAERTAIVKKFDPAQPRDERGRWTLIGAALKHLAHDFGQVIAHEEFGEPGHEHASHGVFALHADEDATLHAINEDGTISHVADSLSHDDLQQLSYAVTDALNTDLPEGEGFHSEDVAEVAGIRVTRGRMDDGTPFVALDGENDAVTLTDEHAETLAEQLDSLADKSFRYDPGGLFNRDPLDEDETLVSRRAVAVDTGNELLLGLVDTPAGRRVRLSLSGGDDDSPHDFTAGRGPLVADLDAATAATLDAEIDDVWSEGDNLNDRAYGADQAAEAWDETPDGLRFAELLAKERKAPRPDSPISNQMYRRDGPPLTAEEQAEFDRLGGTREAFYAGLPEEGQDYTEPREIATPWGAVSVRGVSTGDGFEVRVGVIPEGWERQEWEDHLKELGEDVPQAGFGSDAGGDLDRFQRLLRDAFSGGEQVTKSARAAATGNEGNARRLKRYWTRGKGLAKWVRSAHPWTTLRRHLGKYIHDPDKLDRTTSQWFHDATGMWSGERKGKNPLGRG